jgi:hypothetical protein
MRSTYLFFVGLLVATVYVNAAELKPGRATGTFRHAGTTVAIEHAATFVDHDDKREAVVLILSNSPIDTGGWKTGLDFMRYRMKNPFLGVAFWLDEERKVVRAAYFDKDGMPLGDAKLFEVSIEPAGSGFKGSARTTDAATTTKDPVMLDVTFHAPGPGGTVTSSTSPGR